MTDFEPLQQKQEANDVGAEFRRGLEELMRGHLDDCMSLTSCSSAREPDGTDEDEVDPLVRRRRRSDLEGDDLAESSAARRRHSRILSRWAARQAQEMITTMERRNRESELMALAGLHTVSMLDSSFLRESSQSPTSRRQGPVERPSTQASSLLQMWRELEDEHLLSRPRDRARSRANRNSEDNIGNENSASAINLSGVTESPVNGSQAVSSEDASESENEFWAQTQLGSQNERGDDQNSSREQSPDIGDGERERVRQIVRGWVRENGISSDRSSQVSQRNSDNQRAEWMGETERERVRLVREWVQMASQQRDARASRGEERAAIDTQVERDQDENQPEHIRRERLRLRGRQALLDLLVRIERERQRELQGLLEHRAVSDFAHRNRIQSLLRGRFLRNERSIEDERPPSMAARELGQLRQRHTVSGLREGFRSRLENIVRGQVSSQSDTPSNPNLVGLRNDPSSSSLTERSSEIHEQAPSRTQETDVPEVSEDGNAREQVSHANISSERINWQDSSAQAVSWQGEIANEQRDWQQSADGALNEWQNDHSDHDDSNWEDRGGQVWPGQSPEHDDVGDVSNLDEGQEHWREDIPQEAIENWQDAGPSGSSRTRRSIPVRRVNRFHPPDDDNVYSMELRELLSRRSVSNLLRSGFRESLDQLIQSYVQRQGRSPYDWDLHRAMPTPASTVQNQGQQRDDQNEEQSDAVARPPLVLPSPPVPPPQPLWHQDIHHTTWPRHGMHRSEMEWEIINDLRADMARLQQGMSHMQRMLEACMDMQLELQRSVRQEVSAALNRSSGGRGVGEESSEDGSKCVHVRKGICCVCCDDHIDSLLYRCGHMCTCSKCANELVRGDGKCPLCRAPIIEVIRAYSIL
ncbi:hypothetical protein H6P81_017551 [Aristolochia fimbriata]|uniref:RING-type domain-containing protein n=1 Tax=Aristolochia fimbriata TaxID=158543 RepID=A0AAV7DYX2_ARIFI|nr:hypothetical protein H6P81_017551 [Aristolochia fimbriata]